uniref:Terminal uridylyltransferase 7-like n=1 Tax=Nicotiana tabacum TaxID=4097 RepID=A0A1S3ZVF6_TOBAC|nr:PREDICTED: terminal uridylyltransferase 7-like [Nicotiana tabacum]
MVLKAESSESSDEDSDMAYLTKRFQTMVQRHGGIPKWGSSSKARNNDLCHRCGKPGHFIKDCPLAKQKQYKQNPNKAAKRSLAFAAWGDSSSKFEKEPYAENSFMMEVETEATKYDSLFALMAQSDDDREDEDDEGTVRGSGLKWTMDCGCSKHVTKNIVNFFSLKALQEGNVSLKRKERYQSDNWPSGLSGQRKQEHPLGRL